MVNRVIIIDDDPISILVTGTTMRKNDFARELSSFEKPEKALEYFKNDHPWEEGAPDYIFLDVQMPRMNAWEFMDHYLDIYNSSEKRKHIILLSATFNPDDEDQARKHPLVLELITKPINGRILERLL